MGMDLHGKQGDLYCNNWAWDYILKTAYNFGWVPQGTIAPDDDSDWNGSYVINGYQRVSDEDARALGEALFRAIANVPPSHPPLQPVISCQFAISNEKILKVLEKMFGVQPPFDDEIRLLSEVAAYVLKGGFSIG